MLRRNVARPAARSITSHRRQFLGGVVVSLIVSAGVRRSAVAASSKFDGIAPPLGATYVGRTSDPGTLIAIVLPDDAPGEAVAFFCGGAGQSLWFTGRSRAGTLSLAMPASAESDSERTVAAPAPTLSGWFDTYGLNGEIALPDHVVTFRAAPAAGVAGLYAAEREADGQVWGRASTGALLSARQGAVADGATPFRIAGTVQLADGEHVSVEIPTWTDDVTTMRWIMLADGHVRGTREPGSSAASGFVKRTVRR